ncbi:MAG: RHS repeat-associated core domain-containing protein [Propionivibrio sp.]
MSKRIARHATHPITTILLLAGLVLPLLAPAATQTRTSAFAYDAVTGQRTKEILEPDNGALCLVTDYVYDAYGNRTVSVQRNCNGTNGEAAPPSGDAVIEVRTTTDTYDSRGQYPVNSSNALSQTESKTYDPRWGKPTRLTGPNGLSTTWSYDGFGRKIKEVRADGTQTQWDYLYCAGINGGTASCPTIGGAAGAWLIRETPLASDGVTPNGPIGKTYHDGLDRVIRRESQGYDGSGAATAIYQDTRYDSLGRPYMTSRPYYSGQTAYWTTLTYDALGRPVQETQPDGSLSSTVYNGLSVKVTNAKNQTRTTVKNSQGQIVRVTDAQNQSLTYAYDPFGNLTSTTDVQGNLVSLAYDLRGRKVQMNDPDMGAWTYAYDALGQLIRQTDAKGQVTRLSYDTLGRLTERSEADLISRWYYDADKRGGACGKGIGKLCQSENSIGYNQTLTYDSLGRESHRAVTIDVPTPYDLALTYDAHGRLQTRTYPGGLAVRNVYTALGYLKEVRNDATGARYWQADSRDAEGRLLQQTYGNTIQTTHSYHPATGRLTGIQAGPGNTVQNLAYQYDALGNVTARSDATQGLAETFTYDSLNRLTSGTVNGSPGLQTQSFTYDGLGNLASKSDLGTYAYPAGGAHSQHPHAVAQINLTGGGSIAFAYDANGALVSQTQTDANAAVVAGKGRSQFYTSFGMPQAMAQGTLSAAFYYGPEHQRIKQISSVQGTTIYVNPDNEGALLFEQDIKPDGSIEQRSFINADGQAVAIVRNTTVGDTSTESTRYLHRDHLGSLTTLSDEAGAALERLAYEPFGKRRQANGAADPDNALLPQTSDRGFTGHEMLDELGLIHMNGRVYDPTVGRFLSADPHIQDPKALQSFNRYAYVLNNPLNTTDPSGYFSYNSYGSDDTSTYYSNTDSSHSVTTSYVNGHEVSSTVNTPCSSSCIPTIDLTKDTSNTQSNWNTAFNWSRSSGSSGTSSTNSGSGVIGSVGHSLKHVNDFATGGFGLKTAEAFAKGDSLGGVGYTLAGATYGVLNILTLGDGTTINGMIRGAVGLESAAIREASEIAASSLQRARLSMQLRVEQAAGARAPTEITSYSEHAIQQIAGRDGGIGVNQTAIDSAFNSPVNIQYAPSQYGPTFRYIGQDATVVVNAQGNVVTVWGTSAMGVAK